MGLIRLLAALTVGGAHAIDDITASSAALGYDTPGRVRAAVAYSAMTVFDSCRTCLSGDPASPPPRLRLQARQRWLYLNRLTR